MLLTEWNIEDAKEVWREEALEEGIEKGRAEGHEKGLIEGREKGLEKGREERNIEIARSALAEGATLEFVQKITGLDAAIIKGLTIGGK